MKTTLQEIGEIIKKERVKLKLTQLELADFSGCGLTFINQLERGKTTVRLDKVLQVLKALGISVALSKGKNSVLIKAP